MGAGIALVAAQNARLRVVVMDRDKKKLGEAQKYADKLLSKAVEKGTVPAAEKDKILGLLTTTTTLADFKDCDFVVEAATENLELKKNIFTELSAATKPSAILASNTSSISITKLGAATSRAPQVIGMHFMNPVPVMKLVEVISGIATSQATLDTTLALAAKMGKGAMRESYLPR